MSASVPLIDSPCVRRCALNDDNICIGCGRTLAEIAAWGGMSPTEKIACKQGAAERWPTLQCRDGPDLHRGPA